MDGPGIITWLDENGNEEMVYAGNFKDQQKSGIGILNNIKLRQRYYGYYEKDRYQGLGSLQYASGACYIGKFENGK